MTYGRSTYGHGVGYTIYFARGAGLIKIGITTNLKSRIQGFKTGCPVDIELLASCPGFLWDEYQLHETFFDSRHHYEWFLPTERLLSLIEDVNRTGALPEDMRGMPGRSNPLSGPRLCAIARRLAAA